MRAVALFTLCVLACSEPRDKAAKARIFSPEDPPPAVAAASEDLSQRLGAPDERLAERLLTMSAAEVTERLGAHQYLAKISWQWKSKVGTEVGLLETRDILAGPGGIAGNYRVETTSDHDWGIEIIRSQGRYFARQLWGRNGATQFRERLRDRGMGDRVREDAFGSLRELYGLFGRRILLGKPTRGTFAGRAVLRYPLRLGGSAPAQADTLPPLLIPKGGVDDTTRRRRRFWEKRTPMNLTGELAVDAANGVILSAKLAGLIRVTGEEAADLSINLESNIGRIGEIIRVTAPESFLPDQDRPDAVAAALRRYGFQRLPDGGVSMSGDTNKNDAGVEEE